MQHASTGDSGNYTCQPAQSRPASISLHVLQGILGQPPSACMSSKVFSSLSYGGYNKSRPLMSLNYQFPGNFELISEGRGPTFGNDIFRVFNILKWYIKLLNISPFPPTTTRNNLKIFRGKSGVKIRLIVYIYCNSFEEYFVNMTVNMNIVQYINKHIFCFSILSVCLTSLHCFYFPSFLQENTRRPFRRERSLSSLASFSPPPCSSPVRSRTDSCSPCCPSTNLSSTVCVQCTVYMPCSYFQFGFG